MDAVQCHDRSITRRGQVWQAAGYWRSTPAGAGPGVRDARCRRGFHFPSRGRRVGALLLRGLPRCLCPPREEDGGKRIDGFREEWILACGPSAIGKKKGEQRKEFRRKRVDERTDAH